jgi:IS1 family transposase
MVGLWEFVLGERFSQEFRDFTRVFRKVTNGPIECSDTWKAYADIASRGFIHSPVNYGEKQYSDGKGNHINGLEGV